MQLSEGSLCEQLAVNDECAAGEFSTQTFAQTSGSPATVGSHSLLSEHRYSVPPSRRAVPDLHAALHVRPIVLFAAGHSPAGSTICGCTFASSRGTPVHQPGLGMHRIGGPLSDQVPSRHMYVLVLPLLS